MSSDKYPDGTLRPYDESGSQWGYFPLYEEIVHLPYSCGHQGPLPETTAGGDGGLDSRLRGKDGWGWG